MRAETTRDRSSRQWSRRRGCGQRQNAGPRAANLDPFIVLENLHGLENTGLSDVGSRSRALAYMENLRRRTEKEVADAKTYGVTSFARDMLTFADNLHRALANVPAEARAKAEPAVKSLIEGLELTDRDFASRLERHGVRKRPIRSARNSTPICMRRCSSSRTRACRPAPSYR